MLSSAILLYYYNENATGIAATTATSMVMMTVMNWILLKSLLNVPRKKEEKKTHSQYIIEYVDVVDATDVVV